MASDPVSVVSEADQAQAIATIVSAFANDPVERWLFPETEQYRRSFPEFVTAFAGAAFEQETAWMLDGLAAVAVWLEPDSEPDGTAIETVLSENVEPGKHDDMFAVLEQMEDEHPDFAHWYLPWLGVRSGAQGEGRGSQLLAHCLQIVDESHLPAYLETPNPRTVALYRRHGFEVTATAQSGSCPPMTMMLREPS
jgi:ribosomal protein S18 acetylase RimI-like enzyme